MLLLMVLKLAALGLCWNTGGEASQVDRIKAQRFASPAYDVVEKAAETGYTKPRAKLFTTPVLRGKTVNLLQPIACKVLHSTKVGRMIGGLCNRLQYFDKVQLRV